MDELELDYEESLPPPSPRPCTPPPQPQSEVTEIPKKRTEIPKKVTEIPKKRTEIPKKVSEIPKKKTEIPKKKTEIPKKRTEIPKKVAELPKNSRELPKNARDLPTTLAPGNSPKATARPQTRPTSGINSLTLRAPVAKIPKRDPPQSSLIPSLLDNAAMFLQKRQEEEAAARLSRWPKTQRPERIKGPSNKRARDRHRQDRHRMRHPDTQTPMGAHFTPRLTPHFTPPSNPSPFTCLAAHAAGVEIAQRYGLELLRAQGPSISERGGCQGSTNRGGPWRAGVRGDPASRRNRGRRGRPRPQTGLGRGMDSHR